MSFDRANTKIVEWADGQGMFKRAEDPALRVISLGAGVQSTTMALMAAHGEIGPMPDCAIFADTGWEPKAVYDHLNWLMSPNVLPFPVIVVDNGNIRDDLTETVEGQKPALVPYFLKNPDGTSGMGKRQCTSDYKITPLRWKVRELLGAGRRDRIPKDTVELWMGISTDESGRMAPARQQWMIHRWPLIEANVSRQDCLRWMDRNGYPMPPKSSCIGCPFHNDSMWRDMRDTDPESWADAVEVDKIIRNKKSHLKGQRFSHRSLVPLDEVDLSTEEDRGQLNFFVNECEGMCGV